MYNDLKDEKIIVEIRNLVDDINQAKDDLDMYCEFMKDLFLSGSGRN